MRLTEDFFWSRLRRSAIAGVLKLSLTACPDDDDYRTPYEPPTYNNSGPTAVALGPEGLIPVGETAMLDGSASFDSDGDYLIFSWQWVSRPSGSNATLSAASTNMAGFTVDVGGIYIAKLTITRSGSRRTFSSLRR